MTQDITRQAEELCNSIAAADPDAARRTLDWIHQQQVEKEVMFGGESVPTLLRPNFLSDRQTRLLEHVTIVIMNALEKVVRLYFESDVLHDVIRLNSFEKEMVSVDTRIDRVILKGRLDAFLQGENLKFLEFNCDSPAGPAYGEVQSEIFNETGLIEKLKEKFRIDWVARRQMMLDALLQAYREYGGTEEKPHFAITDWRDVKTIHEFYMLKSYFESQGYPTTVCDPRDFELAGGRLCAGGRPVDMVYRRVIIREVLEKKDEVADFIKAYRDNLICVANPFKSKVVSNKSTLAVLTDSRFDNLFTDEENEIKYRHIPWTRNLLPGRVQYKGKEHDIFELAAADREGFVIKPADGYGGKDVFIGQEVSQSEWDSVLETAAGGGRIWVLQELVDIPEEDFPIFEDGAFSLEKRKVNLNPFAIGGRYAGCISRISKYPIINVSAGGGMVPTFTLKPR